MANIPNYFDQTPNKEVEDEFMDQPDEVTPGQAAPDVEVAATPVPRPQRPTTATVQLPEPQQDEDVESYEKSEYNEEPQDVQEVMSDARFRLEQGRLYEMVLNHDIFEGLDADKNAIKVVQDEIRAYAQERMEIMLGMRHEKSQELNTNAFEAFSQVFPFNSLEVEALKSLAAAATKGASRTAAPMEIGPQPAPAPTRKTLNPIGKGATRPLITHRTNAPAQKPLPRQPTAPVKRTKTDAAIQRILEEEGVTMEQINQVYDPKKKFLTTEEFQSLTAEQVIERNKQIRNQQVANPHAIPMPTQEMMEAMAMARATQAAAHPQMQKIMGLLEEAQLKKGK